MTGLFSAPKPRRPAPYWVVPLLIVVVMLMLLARAAKRQTRAEVAGQLVRTLMSFDRNGDGKLDRSEVPERMQGLFDRGDSNHDGFLTPEELKKLAEAEALPNRR